MPTGITRHSCPHLHWQPKDRQHEHVPPYQQRVRGLGSCDVDGCVPCPERHPGSLRKEAPRNTRRGRPAPLPPHAQTPCALTARTDSRRSRKCLLNDSHVLPPCSSRPLICRASHHHPSSVIASHRGRALPDPFFPHLAPSRRLTAPAASSSCAIPCLPRWSSAPAPERTRRVTASQPSPLRAARAAAATTTADDPPAPSLLTLSSHLLSGACHQPKRPALSLAPDHRSSYYAAAAPAALH